MADDKKLAKAGIIFNTLCGKLDEMKVTYEIHEEDLVVTFVAKGNDLPMKFVLNIDAKRELIRLLSLIPAKFGGEKKVEGAIATNQVNFKLADGSFDFDYETGLIMFRMTSSYVDSLISGELFGYMVTIALLTVDEYNDKFLLLSRGMMKLEDFFK